MSKKKNNILGTVIEEYNKEKLLEDCNKYGIEYHEPYFEPVMFIVGKDDVAIPYFYLGTDIEKSENMQNAIKEFNKAFWNYRKNEDSINPFKVAFASFKYDRLAKKLERIEKAENIRCYTRYEMNNYLDNYRKEKEAEVNNAKAMVDNANAENNKNQAEQEM